MKILPLTVCLVFFVSCAEVLNKESSNKAADGRANSSEASLVEKGSYAELYYPKHIYSESDNRCGGNKSVTINYYKNRGDVNDFTKLSGYVKSVLLCRDKDPEDGKTYSDLFISDLFISDIVIKN